MWKLRYVLHLRNLVLAYAFDRHFSKLHYNILKLHITEKMRLKELLYFTFQKVFFCFVWKKPLFILNLVFRSNFYWRLNKSIQWSVIEILWDIEFFFSALIFFSFFKTYARIGFQLSASMQPFIFRRKTCVMNKKNRWKLQLSMTNVVSNGDEMELIECYSFRSSDAPWATTKKMKVERLGIKTKMHDSMHWNRVHCCVKMWFQQFHESNFTNSIYLGWNYFNKKS